MQKQKAKGKYIVLDHKDDLILKVVGGVLEDLFHQALEGLAYLACKNLRTSTINELRVPIKVSSIDINSLLVDFLSEVIYQSDIHGAVFSEMKVNKFSNSHLEAEILGYKTPNTDRKIKGVSYQGLRVLRNPLGRWQTEIVFEI